MECLEDHVYDEIMELNTHILDTPPQRGDCPFLKHDAIKLQKPEDLDS